MSLRFNLRHLEKASLTLRGELPIAELDLGEPDELIRLPPRLHYDLVAQTLGQAVLVQGRLELTLTCECVRCLREFPYPLVLAEWTAHLPLSGEERVAVVDDCVDLTPLVREDILLAFPQHPVCRSECQGLPRALPPRGRQPREVPSADPDVSVWAVLDKLKF